MKLKNAGAFFWKDDKHNVLYCFYVKTNYLLKKHPDAKLMGDWDKEAKKFIEKKHSPNKIWGVLFDENGRDYMMTEDVSFKDFEKGFEEKEFYDYADYTPETLYEKLKETGLNRRFTKKWFTGTFESLERQLAQL